jgi:hypothetical protein
MEEGGVGGKEELGGREGEGHKSGSERGKYWSDTTIMFCNEPLLIFTGRWWVHTLCIKRTFDHLDDRVDHLEENFDKRLRVAERRGGRRGWDESEMGPSETKRAGTGGVTFHGA